MMESIGADWKPCHHVGTIIHVAIDGRYEGHIVISDVPKEGSKEAIASLKKNGIRQTVMLTGDSKEVADHVGGELGLDIIKSQLLPQDKVSEVERLLDDRDSEKEILAFVGDGINDAPVLSRADIGIAMGGLGSDAAIEAADVVLMDDDPRKIVTAIRISRKCLRIVKENIWFAIGVKVLVLILGALGFANMWAAIFADVGVTVIAVINAIRCMKI
jgi:Cd2+/Zn2+-exporting ATPase